LHPYAVTAHQLQPAIDQLCTSLTRPLRAPQNYKGFVLCPVEEIGIHLVLSDFHGANITRQFVVLILLCVSTGKIFANYEIYPICCKLGQKAPQKEDL
jgi:hypothetical protein